MNHLHKGNSWQSLKQSFFSETFSTTWERFPVSWPAMHILKYVCKTSYFTIEDNLLIFEKFNNYMNCKKHQVTGNKRWIS
jgi:hypothetical protein